MKTFLCGFAALAALSFGMGAANAGWGNWGGNSYGGNRYSAGSGYGSYPAYGGYQNYAPSGGRYRSAPHLDYHPPTVQRHYDHFHVEPGHYDLHYGSHGHR